MSDIITETRRKVSHILSDDGPGYAAVLEKASEGHERRKHYLFRYLFGIGTDIQ